MPLIITADDVGLARGITAGALAACDAGAVTAVSVVACGAARDDALAQLRLRPDLDAGAHLTLVGEQPLSPARDIPSLVGGTGRFLPGYRQFVLRSLRRGIARAEVALELRRQINRLLEGGLRLVHVNSHQHLHLLPGIFEVVVALAVEYRIPFVRVPCGPVLPPLRDVAGVARAAQLAVLNRLGRRARPRLAAAGLRAGDRTLGLPHAGALTLDRLRRSLTHAAGVTELVCHPGLGGGDLAAAYPTWGYAWDEETRALCDPRVADLLRAERIELTSFSKLLAGETAPLVAAASPSYRG